MSALCEADLDSPERTRWPYRDGRPFGLVIGWANLELMKNASEIGQLRRIYRYRDQAAATELLKDHP